MTKIETTATFFFASFGGRDACPNKIVLRHPDGKKTEIQVTGWNLAEKKGEMETRILNYLDPWVKNSSLAEHLASGMREFYIKNFKNSSAYNQLSFDAQREVIRAFERGISMEVNEHTKGEIYSTTCVIPVGTEYFENIQWVSKFQITCTQLIDDEYFPTGGDPKDLGMSITSSVLTCAFIPGILGPEGWDLLTKEDDGYIGRKDEDWR